MSNPKPVTVHEASIATMTTADFMRLLNKKNVQLQARQGRLQINAPAGVVDALLRVQLKARKAALLEALGKVRKDDDLNAVLGPLSAASLAGKIPLTLAQQGMWLIDHFNPGNVSYNIPEAFRSDHPMELATLQSAVDKLIARHSVLRTSFHEEDGELFQSITVAVEARVGFTDLSHLSAAQTERRCREAMRDQAGRAFDLTQAPLVRFHLYRLGARRHVVFFSIHHIIADRTSLHVLREELIALVQAAETGTDAALPALPLQFADYCAWVDRQMRSDLIEGQTAYWKRKLDGLPDFIELSHVRPRPEVRSSSAATRQVDFPAAARSAMDRIGAAEGASPFMTFLAFFAVSLARWSQSVHPGGVDFCIGSPITRRREAATQRMIGLFVNMLAFRCQIEPGMSFRDVVRQVRGTALEAYENSDVPFQRLVQAINPDRRSRRSPVFQVMFGYETYMAPAGNEFAMEADSTAARYDLSLHLWETADGGLMGTIEYCTDLFNEADIDRLGAEGDAVFSEVLRGPDEEIFSVRGESIIKDGTDKGGTHRIHGAAAEGPRDEADVEGAVFEPLQKSGTKGGLFLRTAQLLSGLTMGRGKQRESIAIALED